MRFLLFSKISFELLDPVALIECYCFQSDFYANYDLLCNRKVEHVNKIGARIKRNLLRECEEVTAATKDLRIFKFDLDGFLRQKDEDINSSIRELSAQVIQKLLKIKGIGLSKATKILHTLYPNIIPMIDDPLQEEYRKEIDFSWIEERSNQILFDYYKNLKEENNWRHLSQIFNAISENNLGLTKVRIFDILWWSYLKSKRLRQNRNINWSTIK